MLELDTNLTRKPYPSNSPHSLFPLFLYDRLANIKGVVIVATVRIHYGDCRFYGACKAYLEVCGHTVIDTGPANAAIIDLDYGPPPEVEAEVLICVSARDYGCSELPEHALFRLKPVDVDCLVDWVMAMLE